MPDDAAIALDILNLLHGCEFEVHRNVSADAHRQWVVTQNGGTFTYGRSLEEAVMIAAIEIFL